MKVMEAGAVFLLIGGILLGPIEPIHKPGWGWTDTLECIWDRFMAPKGSAKRGQLCGELSLEPIARTCERAMREIGAFLAPSDLPPGFRMEDETTVRSTDEWRLIGGEKVLCIPAPSGLVR